jgi:hypothetical protein
MRLAIVMLLALLGEHVTAQPLVDVQRSRFCAIDIYLDSNNRPLAAYQFEFSVAGGGAKIVGIEGGEHPAFSQPPHYDPKALQHERVIVAALSTNAVNRLPQGRTRVATVHLQLNQADKPHWRIKVSTAGDADGRKIYVIGTVEERKTK